MLHTDKLPFNDATLLQVFYAHAHRLPHISFALFPRFALALFVDIFAGRKCCTEMFSQHEMKIFSLRHGIIAFNSCH